MQHCFFTFPNHVSPLLHFWIYHLLDCFSFLYIDFILTLQHFLKSLAESALIMSPLEEDGMYCFAYVGWYVDQVVPIND